ncbi:putative papain-like cysteine peptidase superfamily [Helianthus annuus]|nr:putative papain-like cysteine peptidase superfamily [Helianthus annuus]
MENVAITIIDNMDVSESPIEFVNDSDLFKKMTPRKVEDIFSKYLKSVNHPKCGQFEGIILERLEIEWATVGNNVDCGVFAMRHMETWCGETELKWDSEFPLAHTQNKAYLTRLRKKYAVKIVCSHANMLRDELMAEAVAYNVENRPNI